MKKSMLQRIIFGAFAIALLVGIFWVDWKLGKLRSGEYMPTIGRYSGLGLAIFFLPFLLLGFLEFAKMANSLGIKLLRFTGLFGTALLAFQPLIRHYFNNYAQFSSVRAQLGDIFGNLHFLVGAILALAFLEQMFRYRLADALRRVSCTMCGVLYLGICGGLMLNIRLAGKTPSSGLAYLVAFVVIVKITDIAAYFTGSFLGKHKLIPWLSPGKSWEGLIGGLAVATICGVAYWRIGLGWDNFAFPPCAPPTWWVGALFGLTLGIVGQFADLCESLLKRSAEVKDSGAVLPQFGGILDMIDSPLIAAPLGYLWIVVFSEYSGNF